MPSTRQQPMAVIGAGSWGTALAIQLARAEFRHACGAGTPYRCRPLQRVRCNERYLPDAAFPAALEIAADLRAVLVGVRRRARSWCPRLHFAPPWSWWGAT